MVLAVAIGAGLRMLWRWSTMPIRGSAGNVLASGRTPRLD
jgi:hypothetical protein